MAHDDIYREQIFYRENLRFDPAPRYSKEVAKPTRPPTNSSQRFVQGTSVGVLSGTLILASALGALLGVGGYTFQYAKGLSYFRTDPAACANCHIMQSQYDSWQKASHHTAAVCVDCHLPHDFIPKYLAKAENGYRHGKLFTTQTFVEPIEIQPAGREILEANCMRCHGDITDQISPEAHPGASYVSRDGDLACTHCHAMVGHGARSALGGPLRAHELTPHSLPSHSDPQATP